MSDPIIHELVATFSKAANQTLKETIGDLKSDPLCPETSETIGGLLARQCSLACQFAIAPQLWTDAAAPLFLRPMVECLISLSWISKSPQERARKFVLYGIGQEKLLIEHFKQRDKENPKPGLAEKIKEWEEALATQRFPWITDVNVGSWSDIDLRKMADETGLGDWYRFHFQPFSAAIHSTWQHISTYNLRMCINPLHNFHRVPFSEHQRPDPNNLRRAAHIFDETFVSARKELGLKRKSPLTTSALDRFFSKLGKKKKVRPSSGTAGN